MKYVDTRFKNYSLSEWMRLMCVQLECDELGRARALVEDEPTYGRWCTPSTGRFSVGRFLAGNPQFVDVSNEFAFIHRTTLEILQEAAERATREATANLRTEAIVQCAEELVALQQRMKKVYETGRQIARDALEESRSDNHGR